jgi:hypothetical protein
MNFNKLAQANVNHYNNHPTAHCLIIAVYGAMVVVGARLWTKRLQKADPLHKN